MEQEKYDFIQKLIELATQKLEDPNFIPPWQRPFVFNPYPFDLSLLPFLEYPQQEQAEILAQDVKYYYGEPIICTFYESSI